MEDESVPDSQMPDMDTREEGIAALMSSRISIPSKNIAARRAFVATVAASVATHSHTQEARPGASERRARFGPRSAPLFYTALPKLPARLSWETQPDAAAYHVTLDQYGTEQSEPVSLVNVLVPGDADSLVLPALSPCADAVYVWRAAPVTGEGEERIEPSYNGVASGGCFWLTNREQAERWERSRPLFAPMPDADFRAIAEALLLSELGMYHAAQRKIQEMTSRLLDAGRISLAHTSQALLYRQMGLRLQEENRLPAPLEAQRQQFLTWASAREAHFQTLAQTPTVPQTGRTAPAAASGAGRLARGLQPAMPAAYAA